MAHEIEAMAYVGQEPWHGLGTRLVAVPGVDEMLEQAGLDWTVSKRPLFTWRARGEPLDVKGHKALVRDTDNRVLSVVTDRYVPVQNRQAFEFFRRFCDAGHLELETAGSLKGGGFIWALARVGQDFNACPGPGSGVGLAGYGQTDEVRNFVLLMNSHQATHALTVQFTPIRVVCWNTLTLAMGEGIEGRSLPRARHGGERVFRMPHLREFDAEARRLAALTLGLLDDQIGQFRELVARLGRTPFPVEARDPYIREVFGLPPGRSLGQAGPEEESEVGARLVPKILDAFDHAPGQELESARGTAWGAVSAVSWFVDHGRGRSRDSALTSAWFGQGAALKRRALDRAAGLVGA
jgi:phage/plasmid-like protein (TIGR03299 family)